MSAVRPSPLSRSVPPAPVRHVHLGLGNFFRAHQAVYTAHSPDAAEWGIAAFTGRSAELALTLNAQDNLYTVITRGAEGDAFDVVGTVSQAYAASEHERWLGHLADPQVQIVTLTVTEAAYRRGHDGGLDEHDASLRRDLDALRGDHRARVGTVPGRLVAGLAARRRADAGPLTIVACDNVPDNGAAVAAVVAGFAERVDPRLATWIEASVGWVSTVVDRITPRASAADVAEVAARTGRDDRAPVVTEPFTEWILGDGFVTDHPSWTTAGAKFTSHRATFEHRKLWLLNGAHSLLAYGGPARGHRTVAEAIGDQTCRGWVEQWWGEACRHLPLPAAELDAYRAALLARFGNPRIEHRLAQIAADGSVKLPVRILPVLHAELGEGRLPAGAVRTLAAWAWHLRTSDGGVDDPDAGALTAAAAGAVPDAVTAVLARLDPELAASEDVVAATVDAVAELSAGPAR